MSAHSRHTDISSGGSPFTKAAWYSLLVPPLTPVVWFFIGLLTDGRLGFAFGAVFWMLVSSFIFGVASLFGIRKHCRKRILWTAVPGIIASLILGFLAFVYWDMMQTWHG